MTLCWACCGLVLLSATVSRASRTANTIDKDPLELPMPSQTIVHLRSDQKHPQSHMPTVDFSVKDQKAPVVGKTTKTVVHQKVPGNGYKPGSPLYNVQEGKTGAVKHAEPQNVTEPQNGTREEKLYACVDRELAKLDAVVDRVSPQEVMEGTNACMTKYDATPVEALGIRDRTIKAIWKHHFWTVLVAEVIVFLLILAAAFVYQRQKKDPEPTRRGMTMTNDDWHAGICSCFEVPGMTLLTCCCFSIRWADTMRMASYMSFWVGVVLMTLLEMINSFTGGAAMCFAWGIVVFYRQKLRKEFGLEHSTVKSCCCDICGYCWIPCCMAVQEARQLEEAYAVGHPIRKL